MAGACGSRNHKLIFKACISPALQPPSQLEQRNIKRDAEKNTLPLTQWLAITNLLAGHSHHGFRVYQTQVMPRLSSRWTTRVFPQSTASPFDGKREIVNVTGRLGTWRDAPTFFARLNQTGVLSPARESASVVTISLNKIATPTGGASSSRERPPFLIRRCFPSRVSQLRTLS